MKKNNELEEDEPLINKKQQTPLPERSEQRQQAQHIMQQPQQPQEETLDITLNKEEVIKLLALIERNEDFILSNRLEITNSITEIHTALYKWIVSIQQEDS